MFLIVLQPSLIAHVGEPPLPHDAFTSWNADPLIILGVVVTGWLYWRGWRPAHDGARGAAAMLAGLIVVVLALLSPVDAVGHVLLTGHMVQHVLLVTVAAPLIAWAAPGTVMLRGTPVRLRRFFVRGRRAVGIDVTVVSRLRHPVGRWLLLVVTLWLWHSARLYSLAVDSDVWHALEHASFLGSALLFWSIIVGPEHVRLQPGLAILAVFALTLQGIVLSMLMTFSPLVWYEPYADSAIGWGLDPLEDQQLAGVIMWIPTGFVHVGITAALVARWLRTVSSNGPQPNRTRRSRVPNAEVP